MPELTFTRLAGSADADRLVVVGPSLGTSVEALWSTTARVLGADAEVVGWDLPGHGRSPATSDPFTVAELADTVRSRVAELAAGRPASYAGVSLGGTVALQLVLDPGPFDALVVIASAAVIGEPAAWHERAALVRRAGTPVMVEPSSRRWFAPGFLDRDPGAANALLHSLSDADAESYARACEALAGFDLRDRFAAEAGNAEAAVVVAPGEHDEVVTVEHARDTAARTAARVVVLQGCGHLPPAEDPAAVADLITATWRDLADG